jgi:hypothetical protein
MIQIWLQVEAHVKDLFRSFVLIEIVCSHMSTILAPGSVRYVNYIFMFFFAGATPFVACLHSQPAGSSV